MSNEEIIIQLESIAENSKSFITKDSDPIWEKDIQAINAAIKIIENENTDISNISKNEEVYQKAITIYGSKNQIDMMLEEMSELQKELCKFRRGRNNLDNIAEEIADVEIMLEQMKIIFDVKDKVNIYKDFKIKRLEKRLDIIDRIEKHFEKAMLAIINITGTNND